METSHRCEAGLSRSHYVPVSRQREPRTGEMGRGCGVYADRRF